MLRVLMPRDRMWLSQLQSVVLVSSVLLVDLQRMMMQEKSPLPPVDD